LTYEEKTRLICIVLKNALIFLTRSIHLATYFLDRQLAFLNKFAFQRQ